MWHWEKVNVNFGGSSGDLAKLFKNEDVKCPSLLASNAPSADAVLLAREVIQNSWDAAIELKKTMTDQGDTYPGFSIDFKFERLDGEEGRKIVDALDLGSVAERLQSLTAASTDENAVNATTLGLSENNYLENFDGNSPLSVLRIIESGATGMYGPWDGDKSKLFVAMIYFGTTIKPAGSGGSYGFGKSGLIRGSRTRTVVAYTCFQERADDPGITRRLLGVNYWGRHADGGSSYSGFGRLGAPAGEFVEPFVNDEADAFAARLGMDIRDPSDPEDLGTTFLLIDPTVNPEELNEAILRNWWPAILDHDFSVQIFPQSGGRPIHPKARQSEVLRPFVEAYDIARHNQDNALEVDRRKFTIVGGSGVLSGGSRKLGELGLVAELGDWSYPKPVAISEVDESIPIEHRSLVALVRGPKMVVEYLELGSRQPFVRGTFVASAEVDELLRQTEPAAHDSWQTNVSDGVAEEATTTAAQALRTIRRKLDDFRSDLKPETPKPEDIRLPELDKLFRRLVNGTGPVAPPPPQGERDIAISISSHDLEESEVPGMILMRATAIFSHASNQGLAEMDEATAKVRLLAKVQYLEDERRGDLVPLKSVQVDGSDVPGYSASTGFVVDLGSHQSLSLSIETEPFTADASCSTLFDAQLVDPQEDAPNE